MFKFNFKFCSFFTVYIAEAESGKRRLQDEKEVTKDYSVISKL